MILIGGYPFSILLSAVIFFFLFIYSFRIRKSPGAVFLIILMALLSLQGVFSIFELLANSLEEKLFWRNAQQIPLYYSPVMLMGIVMSFTDVSYKVLIRRIVILSSISFIYWILLFTDPLHHLIRDTVWLESYGEFERLQMTRTHLGYLFMAYIYALAVWGLGLLIINYRKSVGRQRIQHILIMIAILSPYVLPDLVALAGWTLNVAVSSLPTGILIFYAMHMHKFLQVRPLAKEKVFEYMSEGILIVDEQDRIIDANPAAQLISKHLGMKRKLIGSAIVDLFEGNSDLYGLYKEGKQGEIEVQADGHSFEVRFIPIRVRNKRTGSLFIFLDITDRKNYENELIQRAATDGLTNLYNRVQFLEQLDLERKKCELNGKPISLILIDIDNFKKINDQYGHLAGDQVLVHIAGLLKDTLGEDGVAGRMGGEEFAVYLSGMDGETAYQTAERLRVRVQREPLRFSKSNESAGDIAYTISIGVAELHDFHIKLETWYNQADICLYASKKYGRNQTTLFRLREHFAGVTPGHG